MSFSVGTEVHSKGGESRPPGRRYTSRPTSPSPSYETALGPFRRFRVRSRRAGSPGPFLCRSDSHCDCHCDCHRLWVLSEVRRRHGVSRACGAISRIPPRGTGSRSPLDARRRLHDDVHAPARHHDRERRAAEHPAAAPRRPDRAPVGGRRVCAHARGADPDGGCARRPLRPPARLHGRRGRLQLGVAALRPRLEHRRAGRRPRAAGHRRRGPLRNGAGADRRRIPRTGHRRRNRGLGSHGRSGGRVRPARRRHPHRRAGLALGVLRQRSGRRLRHVRRADQDGRVARRAGRPVGRLGASHLLGGALPDRLRSAARQRQRLDERADRRLPRRRCRPARRSSSSWSSGSPAPCST